MDMTFMMRYVDFMFAPTYLLGDLGEGSSLTEFDSLSYKKI